MIGKDEHPNLPSDPEKDPASDYGFRPALAPAGGMDGRGVVCPGFRSGAGRGGSPGVEGSAGEGAGDAGFGN